jgi:D-amino peptidase
MKVFISADMEGVSGVIHREQILPGTSDYERSRKLLAEEVNAAVQGAIDGGADEVFVNDSHGSMRNILPEDLHPEARLITGFPKNLLMMEGLDSSFDAVVFVGYHTMAGSEGVYSHTISYGTFSKIALNGTVYGETGLNAAIAGHFGVPLIFVSGDDRLRAEVRRLYPDIEFAEVKRARSFMAADCLSPSKARRLIHSKVKQAVLSADACAPFVIDGPIDLEAELKTVAIADVVSVIPGVERVSALSVSYRATDVIEAISMIAAMMYAASVLSLEIYS